MAEKRSEPATCRLTPFRTIYEVKNRLVSVDAGATATYSYDHDNRRIKKTVGSTTTVCIWEGSQVIAEYDQATSSLQAEMIYSGSRLLAKFANSTTRYYLSDRLSERLTLDTSGNIVGRQAHLPFGEELGVSSEQEKHKLTNYERDCETGLDQAINRGYAPSLGRFLSADPYRASGYLVDPQSWNRFNYVHNNPINNIDPLGLDTIKLRGWDCPPGYHSDANGHCVPGSTSDEYVANILGWASTTAQIALSLQRQREQQEKEKREKEGAERQAILQRAVGEVEKRLENDKCASLFGGKEKPLLR